MAFPINRMRRLRKNAGLRRMVREHTVCMNDVVAPIFIGEGEGVKKPIGSMPGVSRFSVDTAVDEAKSIHDLGIPATILFGVPDDADKDAKGTGAWIGKGIVQRATEAIKQAVPDLVVIADTCFCEYTDHGHCGVLSKDHTVDNDATVENLAITAVSQACAGADIIAPSGMMDGMVAAIRKGLDEHNFEHIPIMSYAAKFASAFYGPFREAAESTPSFGDRSAYQMDPANGREALQEALLDKAEGADILMVKPGMAYMDVIRQLRDRVLHPLAVYNVSGEYSMVKAAAANGWVDEKRIALELLTNFKRAGADIIITYWAKDLADWLKRT